MKARLITRFKDVTPDGGVIEWVVWRPPQRVLPTGHGFKTRAAYAVVACGWSDSTMIAARATTAISRGSRRHTTLARSTNW